MIQALTFATYAVTLDERPVLPSARAAVVDGRVLLPVRALGEALGADVRYDARFRRIVVQRGRRAAEIPANGAVRIVAGHAYAPLRTVANAFGMNVDYVARTRTVALNDGGASVAQAVNSAPDPVAQIPASAPAPDRYSVATTPADRASVHEPYPTLSARFAGVSSIDLRSLRVLLDGRDVTADTAVIGDQVMYTPRTALVPGRHDVAINANAASGAPLSAAWSFDDSFAFVAPPPPTPFPLSAIYIDRWVAPGTNAFDVIARGVPGITGFVRVEGIAGIFPFTVATYDAYVAHVYVPGGMNQPFTHIAARLNLPDGSIQTVVLPQTIGLFTPQKPAAAPTLAPTPRVTPPHRSMNVPTFTPSPVPAAKPTATAIPTASPTPAAHTVRVPLKRKPSPSPSPASSA